MKREGKKRREYQSKKSKKSSFRKKQNEKRIGDDGKMRLNKFIANAGICSRREADKFIEAGVGSVNGEGVTEMGLRVSPTDKVKFNGQRLKSETPRYILLNKPKNYSGRIESGTQTTSVMSLVAPACKERVVPIDKLNKNDTGLLLFTNDTNLAKKLSNKSQSIKSIYQLTLDKSLIQNDLDNIKEGIFMNGRTHTFDSISYIKNKDKNEIGIEHNRGGIKYLKGIFEKLNYGITRLDRVFFGGLTK